MVNEFRTAELTTLGCNFSSELERIFALHTLCLRIIKKETCIDCYEKLIYIMNGTFNSGLIVLCL